MSFYICEKNGNCVDCPRIDPNESCEHWVEVKYMRYAGWWKSFDYGDDYRHSFCSMCGRYAIFDYAYDPALDSPIDENGRVMDNCIIEYKTDYCPHCGAKMISEED